MKKVVIIGAGVIGSAIARELSKYQLDINVFEKENDVCEVTSMANSAIVHSGYDPKPGTLKAKLNVLGNKLFDQLSEDLGFEFNRIGSLTVGFDESSLETLKELQKNGLENGVETKILNKEETIAIEPNVNKNVMYSLFAPTCGIVNPFEYTVALMENAVDNGVKLHLCEEVLDIKHDGKYIIKTEKGEYEADIIINAAGLGSAKIAHMINNNDYEISPRKGEYFVLDHFSEDFVKHTIFPLPTNKGKGILITPTTHGNYLLGPTSEFVDDKEDFSTDALTLDKVKEGVVSVCDNIPFYQTIRSFAGLRAVATGNDFIIKEDEKEEGFYHVAGIQSPGLASSYAIAMYIKDLINEKYTLEENENFNGHRRPFVKLNKMTDEEKNEYFKKDPKFANLICRCEKISEGEILDVIHRSVGATTVRGVKKRVRPGFGKCQGGFCEPRVVKLLAKELGKDETEILKGRRDSVITKYVTKEDR